MLGLHGEKERGRKARIKSLEVSVAGKEELGNQTGEGSWKRLDKKSEASHGAL